MISHTHIPVYVRARIHSVIYKHTQIYISGKQFFLHFPLLNVEGSTISFTVKEPVQHRADATSQQIVFAWRKSVKFYTKGQRTLLDLLMISFCNVTESY